MPRDPLSVSNDLELLLTTCRYIRFYCRGYDSHPILVLYIWQADQSERLLVEGERVPRRENEVKGLSSDNDGICSVHSD